MFCAFAFDLRYGILPCVQFTVRRVVWCTTQNGRERPHETFWAAESRKSGVAPARSCSFSTAAFETPAPDVLFSQGLGWGQGEDLGEDEVEEWNSYILHREATVSAQAGTA